MLGPLTQSSPVSPAGTSVSSADMYLAVWLGRRTPTEPMVLSQSSQGLEWVSVIELVASGDLKKLTWVCVVGLVSLRPYPCFMGTFNLLYAASTNSRVKGAAPEFIIRKELRS